MITVEQYFGPWIDHPDATDERLENARQLLLACEALEQMAVEAGVEFPDNPATGSGVSGITYGGFRPQNCPQGAPRSSHKEGLAVDRYDPHGAIDAWCMANQGRMVSCGIFIEHPSATETWSHWTIRPPKSGRVVFYP